MKLKERAAQLRVASVRRSPFFFRSNPAREDLDALKASMERVGQIHAASVVPIPGGGADGVTYELINAHRRHLAATELGWETFNADIYEFDEDELHDPVKRELSIRRFLEAANIQEELTPLERAEQYKNIMELMNMDASDVAQLFNRDEAEVMRDLRYTLIDPEVREELRKPEVARRIGREHLDILAEFASNEKKGWRLEGQQQKQALDWLLEQKDKRAVDNPEVFKRQIKAMKSRDREAKSRDRAEKKADQSAGPEHTVREMFKALDVIEKSALKLHEINPSTDFRMEYIDHTALVSRLTVVARGLVDYSKSIAVKDELVAV